MRKFVVVFSINKNNSNRAANQRLCFRNMDDKIPQLTKSEISSLYRPYILVFVGLGRNPEERFTRDAAHIFYRILSLNTAGK